ncbi:pleckstrin homology domain-containing family G member 6 isoform X1 [Polypterus senegalus]|uniref:pleckstrin homology domain-containing family G member 6 isoform X1 n=2 Tax=Polypterus senegalus TaxID=55291 RepID=UPI00196230F7|nr:pleckstrin homology domain-containing family G member 6 isoform X1 [Polypterus senegalus]XP_039619610.1 pleckstrin homology domain-containing family G member 6 isoform X1 [Polypterus senegalus]
MLEFSRPWKGVTKPVNQPNRSWDHSMLGNRPSSLLSSGISKEHWAEASGDGVTLKAYREFPAVQRQLSNQGTSLLSKLEENKGKWFTISSNQISGRDKTKKVPEYATISKAMSLASKYNRTALRSGLFNQGSTDKDPGRLQQLHNKLSSYSMLGMPKLSANLSTEWEVRRNDDSNVKLEPSWKDIVHGHENMSRKQSHLQEAVWELIYTEAAYLKKLRIVTDLFINGILNLHTCEILTEVQPHRLFSNLPEIIRAHRAFWEQIILPVLLEARKSRKPFDPRCLQPGFMTFSDRFSPYIQYCAAQEKCMEYARQEMEQNELFRIYVAWVETHKQCNRMRLSDMLARPHQRITKYPLLLKSILKRVEETETRDALQNMINKVEEFLHHINSKMQLHEEHQKLAAVAQRIDSYDVVETIGEEVDKHLREFSTLDLTAPMQAVGSQHVRQLLLEGYLKIREGKDSKTEMYTFLFSDLILFTKHQKKTDTAKVTRPPLMIDQAVCRQLKDPASFLLIYLNDFCCAVAAYVIQAQDSKICKQWIEAIHNAQRELIKMKGEESRRKEAEQRLVVKEQGAQAKDSEEGISLYRQVHKASESTRQQGRSDSLIIPQLLVTNDDEELLAVKNGNTVIRNQSDDADEPGSAETEPGAFPRIVNHRIRRQKPLKRPNRKMALLSSSEASTELPSTTGTSQQDIPTIANSDHSNPSLLCPQLTSRSLHALSTSNPDLPSSGTHLSMPDRMLRTQKWLSSSGLGHSSSDLFLRTQQQNTISGSQEAILSIPDFSLGQKSLSASELENKLNSYPRSKSLADTLLRAEAMDRDWGSRQGSEKGFSFSIAMSASDKGWSEDELFSDGEELEFVKGHAHSGTAFKAQSMDGGLEDDEEDEAPFDAEELAHIEKLHSRIREQCSPVFLDSTDTPWNEYRSSDHLESDNMVFQYNSQADDDDEEGEDNILGSREGVQRRLTISELHRIRGIDASEDTFTL